MYFAPSAGHVFMHGLVVSFYFYHSGSCVEYAATFFVAELVNVVWFFHHCLWYPMVRIPLIIIRHKDNRTNRENHKCEHSIL